MRRNLSLLSVIAFCVALMLSFVPASLMTASADDSSVVLTKVSGFEYALSYLAEEAGVTDYDSSTTSVTIGGVKVEKPSDEEGGTSEDAQTAAGFRTDGTSVEFLSASKEYDFVFTTSVENESGETEPSTVNATVQTGTPGEDSLKYSYNQDEYDAYKTSVLAATTVTDSDTDEERAISVDDYYEVPCIASLVKDDYFDVEGLTGTLYYAEPQDTSFSSKSISDLDSVKFTVSEVGTYSFYILLKDTFNSMSVTDLVLAEKSGTYGYYNADDDGNPTGEVVVPVFTFVVGATSSPKITVGTSEKAYKNLTYTVSCFNVVAAGDYNSEYTLYYSEEEISTSSLESFDEDTLTELGLTLVSTENDFEDENLFDSSDQTFTPVKTGYYYVVLHVVDGANEQSTAISRAIDATRELTAVEYETQFFKYNWQSIVLLSVAALCFIAIIVLLCVKPKNGQEVSRLTTKDVTADDAADKKTTK